MRVKSGHWHRRQFVPGTAMEGQLILIAAEPQTIPEGVDVVLLDPSEPVEFPCCEPDRLPSCRRASNKSAPPLRGSFPEGLPRCGVESVL